MNCTNCGAAMKPIVDRHYLYCAHCSTFHFPGELAESVDRVTPLGDASPAECPVCNLRLASGAVERRPVVYCEKCRGLLVSCADFAYIVKTRRARRSGVDGEVTPLNREELERVVNCPHCQRRMDVHPYCGPGAVVIDTCSQCRVVWLDHGEIGAIENAPGRR